MEAVNVPLGGGRTYDIAIGAGTLATAGETVRGVARSNRVVVVSQPTIAKHYGATVVDSLTRAGFDAPETVLFAAGERYKNLRTLEKLYRALYDLSPAIDRKTVLVALGGGVVGDVVGFLAATYLRGLDYVQVPTTLLAMVDSSVGGKTGIDFAQGKNLVGAFHQPRAVVIDTETLATLPKREVTAGLGEVIKYGVIADPAILGCLSDAAYIVRRSCEIKADVVTRDEFETTGLRATLNFGHTVGHAVEAATQYRRFKHGEAVAIGMVSAAHIGQVAGVTPEDVVSTIADACTAMGLPVALPPDIADDEITALLSRDKKAENGRARFVLARALGNVVTGVPVDEATIRAGLALQRARFGID